MKRTVIAAVFLLFALAINIFCAVWINDVFDELKVSIEGACADIEAGDDDGALEKVGRFNETLARNEQGLALFVRRELLYSVALSGATLEAYANAEHAKDFCAEAERALETVRTVRESMFTLS